MQFLQEVALELLHNRLQELTEAKTILLEGFPRNKKQLEDLNDRIGGVNHVILVDVVEAQMRSNLEANYIVSGEDKSLILPRIHLFKHNTLPVLSYFDDEGKLSVVSVNYLV